MNRRSFLITASAAALLPYAAQARAIEYTDGALERAIGRGEPVVLDYFAPWCGTCQAQKRVIAKLWSENPAYADKVTYIVVDWDTWKKQEITQRLQIPRRSTLVAIAPDGRELSRIVAQTGYDDIKALFDAALATASA